MKLSFFRGSNLWNAPDDSAEFSGDSWKEELPSLLENHRFVVDEEGDVLSLLKTDPGYGPLPNDKKNPHKRHGLYFAVSEVKDADSSASFTETSNAEA